MKPTNEGRPSEVDERRIDAALFEPLDTDPSDEFQMLAGLVLAAESEPGESLPEGWLRRLETRFDSEPVRSTRQVGSAERSRSQAAPSLASASSAPSGSAAKLGWLLVGAVAAAFVVGVAIGRWTIGTTVVDPIAEATDPVAEPTLAERLAKLESESDSIRVDWAPNGDGDISGFVVWNDRLQKGYMAFDRLAPNDPAVEQYQLWIFDATRDDERPVDGGVFDVDLAGAEQVDGRTVVEVDAKLPIGHAKMFALTIERPGGVVVSGRERLPGLAVAP